MKNLLYDTFIEFQPFFRKIMYIILLGQIFGINHYISENWFNEPLTWFENAVIILGIYINISLSYLIEKNVS